jgi:hypothetical protein
LRSHDWFWKISSDLIIGDVVDFQPAGFGVAHDHIGFAQHAAEIADADDLPNPTRQYP